MQQQDKKYKTSLLRYICIHFCVFQQSTSSKLREADASSHAASRCGCGAGNKASRVYVSRIVWQGHHCSHLLHIQLTYAPKLSTNQSAVCYAETTISRTSLTSLSYKNVSPQFTDLLVHIPYVRFTVSPKLLYVFSANLKSNSLHENLIRERECSLIRPKIQNTKNTHMDERYTLSPTSTAYL